MAISKFDKHHGDGVEASYQNWRDPARQNSLSLVGRTAARFEIFSGQERDFAALKAAPQYEGPTIILTPEDCGSTEYLAGQEALEFQQALSSKLTQALETRARVTTTARSGDQRVYDAHLLEVFDQGDKTFPISFYGNKNDNPRTLFRSAFRTESHRGSDSIIEVKIEALPADSLISNAALTGETQGTIASKPEPVLLQEPVTESADGRNQDTKALHRSDRVNELADLRRAVLVA